jgi:hypothetical protein
VRVARIRLGGETFARIPAVPVLDFTEDGDTTVQGMLGVPFLVASRAAVDFSKGPAPSRRGPERRSEPEPAGPRPPVDPDPRPRERSGDPRRPLPRARPRRAHHPLYRGERTHAAPSAIREQSPDDPGAIPRPQSQRDHAGRVRLRAGRLRDRGHPAPQPRQIRRLRRIRPHYRTTVHFALAVRPDSVTNRTTYAPDESPSGCQAIPCRPALSTASNGRRARSRPCAS